MLTVKPDPVINAPEHVYISCTIFDLPLRISFKTPEILAKRPQHFQIVYFEAK